MFKEAKEDSELFDEEYDEIIAKEHHDLDEEQLEELKKAYKKASKLCHPDIVTEELKEQAHEIMTELQCSPEKRPKQGS